MTAIRQTWQVTMRGIRVFIRNPAYLAMSVTQPIIWLLLFGALFKSVIRIPGFHGGSYIDFLTPGIVVMLAVSSAGWTRDGLHRGHPRRRDGPDAGRARLARSAERGHRGVRGADCSNGVAVLARQREALIGAVTLVLLPLTFLSTALMQENLVPGWIRTVARFNPVNRAVEAARSAAMQQIDWGLVGSRIGLLAAVTLLSAAFATRAFTKYQRSL